MNLADTFWEEVAMYVILLGAAVSPALALWVMP